MSCSINVSQSYIDLGTISENPATKTPLKSLSPPPVWDLRHVRSSQGIILWLERFALKMNGPLPIFPELRKPSFSPEETCLCIPHALPLLLEGGLSAGSGVAPCQLDGFEEGIEPL